MKPNLRLFKIFLILIAFLVGNFTFAQQKALTEKEKLAKEAQVVKGNDLLQDVIPGAVAKFNYNKPVYSKVDFSKQGNRGLLFDNGPFVTNPGAGVGGADVSLVEPPNTTYGSNYNLTAGYHVADNFTIAANSTIDSLVVFGYQTNSSLTSTFTGLYIQIWNGDPSLPTSTVIWGDLTTNRLTATRWSGCYRALDLVTVARPIMRNVAATAGLTLPAGDYWIEYAATGSLSSGPWVNFITILGQIETGNAIQWTGAAWQPIVDGGSLGAKGLPFLIFGEVVLDPNILYTTDFEDFTAGTKVACQNANWTTWSNAPCGPEDAMVSTDFAHSGVNGVKDDGNNDLVLPLGNKVTGKYQFDFWMYIPSGHGGYYNILHNFAPGAYEWGLEFYFEDAGTGQLHAGGQIIPYPYNHDQWFHIVNIIDIDNDLAEVLVDGTSVYSWQWSLDPSTGNPGLNQLAAVDYYSGAGATGIVNPLYYFDDVLYKDISVPPVVLNPPRNLAAIVTGQNVHLTWDPPASGGTTEELIYDDGVPSGSYSYVGYTMSSHMSPSGPCKILSLKYYTTVTNPSISGFEPRVFDWAGTEPGTTILYETTANAVDNDWMEVDISAQNILVNGDFMVGFGSILDGVYMGYNTTDNGRAWDYDNTNGTWASWYETYLLRAVVEYTDGRIVELSPVNTPPGTKIPKTAMIDHPRGAGVAHTVAPIPSLGSRALLGYNTFRDGAQLNSSTITDLFYDDLNVTPGTYNYTANAVYDEGQSEQTAPIQVVVNPGGLTVVNIGEGTELPGTPRVPFDFYWKNSLCESLYFPEELGQPAGSQIVQVEYHNNFVTTGLVDKPVQIWMGETSQMDLSGGYIPAGDLTLVFDGVVTFPTGINDVNIPLQVPYSYAGGNLVILTYRVWEDVYWSSNDRWYSTTTPEHPNRTAGRALDATVFDPYNPPTDPTILSLIPNTTLYFLSGGGTTIYATDFEAFIAGQQVACQDPVNWTTWTIAPCGTEDAYVSTDFAHSGVNSVKDELANDLVLPLGNKTTGKYEMNFWMYIPGGHGGYYNLLHNFEVGAYEWGMEFYFEDAGTGQLHAAGQIIPYPYNHDQWFLVSNVIDLDNDNAEVFIDGVSVYSWQWSLDPSTGLPGLNQLSATDFFSGVGATGIINPLYYFDDVDYKAAAPPANPRITVSPASFQQELLPNGTATQTLTIGNTGGATLDFSIDISYPAVKSVRIINHKPLAERITTLVPSKKGTVMVEKPGYRVIPEVVDPASIVKSTTFVNKHAPKYGRATVYVNQTGNPSSFGGIASQNFSDYPTYSCAGADDFEVPNGATWNVNHVFASGTFSTTGFEVPGVDVVFYADAAGFPGTEEAIFTNIPCVSDPSGFINIFLPTTVTLTTGHYWVSVAAVMDFATHGQWYWSRETDPLILNEFVWQNPGGGFAGCTSWCYGSVQWPGQADYNLAYALSDSTTAPPPTGWLAAAPLTGSVPAGGTAEVQVTFDATGLGIGVYNGLLSINSNDPTHPVKEVPATLEVKVPGQLPLVEDWNSGSFETNDWTFDPGQSNWTINAGASGNPPPAAEFYWSPTLTNYSFALVTPSLDASAISDNVTLKFDIYLNNYSTSTLEGMAVEVFDGSTWNLVQDYTNVNGNIEWTNEAFNITSFAAGHSFKVRFRAYGANSFNINWWDLDNIKIYQQVVGNLTGTITKLDGGTPIEGALVTIHNALSGTYTATSGANGVYTITGAEAGAYNYSVVKEGFNKIEGNVTIVGNQTTTQDFQMTAPIIGVDPTSLSVTVPVGETTTRTVTVSNTGNGPMNWSGSIHNTVGPVVYYSTDFESFTAGIKVACQDPVNWTTWSLAPCGPEDAMVSADFAHSAVNGVKDDGSNDLVLPLGDKTSGKYQFDFWMYIPGGHGGYYNILHNFAPGAYEWGLEFYFEDAGTGQLHAGGQIIPYPYTHDTWFLISNVIDVDNDLAEVFVDGTSVFSWQWSLDPSTGNPGLNQLAAVDFYSGAGATGIVNPLYYFDDVLYKSVAAKNLAVVPASNGKFPRGTAAASIGRAPVGTSMPSKPLNGKGSIGYAFDIYPGMTFFSFNTDDPATQNVISSIDYAPFGGTFDAVNTDFMYVIDYNTNELKKVEIANGNVTVIGPCNTTGGESWTGITVDKTANIMYGISTNITESHIYTIDMATGAATVIGPTGIPGAIDVAIDGTGQMYSFDIVNDESYKVDKATGASTLLGSIGYDANFAQGMGWDPAADIVYLAAYNNATGSGELRILDRVTGNTTLVGGMGGEIDGLGFPGGGGGNWASIDPSSGTIAPGGSQIVTVTFDGSYVPPQKDLTVQGVLIFATDPNVGSPEVALSMTITGSFFGVLQGTVTHGGAPVGGVTVTATRQESPVYTYTMITGADGVYSFPNTLYGTYDFTAEKAGFNPFTSTTPAIVVGDQTTVYNIAMVAPIMVIAPLEITASTPFGNIITRTILVTNTGDGVLDWAAVATSIDKKQTVSIPASDGKFPRGTAAVSIGRAPVGTSMTSKPLTGKGTLGYAFDIYPGNTFFSFDTDDPATQNVISSIDYAPFGGSFDAVNLDFMYVIDYNSSELKKVEIANGNVTVIGPCNTYGGESWTGIAVDKTTNTMYGISTNISESHIYHIDMETGAATVIGPTGIPGAIDCAIDGAGQMYSFDIVNDEAYKVDKETGASILLGSIGYDANYAQGMSWDPDADIVYLAAYNNSVGQGELRILDKETGNTTLVGVFGGETDALGFPGGGVPPWLTIAPKTGILPPGTSDEMTVTLDGTIPPPAKDFTHHGTISFSSDPNVGSVDVPVTFTVTGDFYGKLEGFVRHAGVGIPNATVTAVKPATPPYTATTDANGHYIIDPILGGTYEVTAAAVGYHPATVTGVVITPPNTTMLDLILTAPTMTITPNELTVNLPAGQTTDRTLNILNSGDGTLNWTASVHVNTRQAFSIPASNGEFPHGTAAPSIGRAPLGNNVAGNPEFQVTSRSLAYAFDIYPGNTFFSFNTDDPGTQTIISSIDYAPFGGTFDAINTDFMYVIDYNTSELKKVEIANGNVTVIGACNTSGGESWTGITVDKTTNVMYGISTNISQSTLYTIDMVTGASTVIGPTGIPGAIDVTVDGTGQMYSFDIVNDESYAINKETGASTLLGSIGYDANYAQGMGWDPEADIVYLAAYNNGGSGGELRVLDRTTGNTALVGGFPGGAEVDGLGFPGGGSAWLSMDPKQGIIPAGNSQNTNVHFDATELANGTYTGYITFLSEPNVGTVTVPVTFVVGPIGGPTVTITQVYDVDAGPVSVPVHATEITNMGSFQFTLDYDASKLTYTGTSNWYPGILDVLVGTPSTGKLTFVWAASTEGITITDGTFFNVDFTYNGSLDFANIAWSDNPTPREFADYNGVIFVPYYNNGFVTGRGVGVPENGPQAIKVYPNPASNVVNVKSDFTIKSIEVLSFIGQTVYTQNNLDTKLVQLNVSSLGSGVYFVKLNTDQGIKTTKITVKH